MKKLITAVLATGLLLVTGAVAAAPASATASASAPSYTRNDNLFYKVVTTDVPSLKFVGKKLLIKTAKTTCKALRSGVEPFDLITMGLESGLTEDEVIAVIAGAITFYCEDQSYLFE